MNNPRADMMIPPLMKYQTALRRTPKLSAVGKFQLSTIGNFAYWLIHKKEGKVKGDFRPE
jgi:hypothetical protein